MRESVRMESLRERWLRDVLLADGAMGTLLFGRGGASSCVELLNVTTPVAVERAHSEYVAAGAQLIESNTFAANRLKLRAHKAADRVREINVAGVERARRAAAGRAYVAGSVGPLGALLRPIGTLDVGQARDIFAEQLEAIASAQPDLLLLETFGSAAEALIALEAARRCAPGLPLLVSLSVVEDGRTADGDDLLLSFRRLRAAGADTVGVNCAVGPQANFDAIAPIIGALDCPVSIMPNAGYPHRVDDRTSYQSAPEYFARFAREFVDIGAAIVGGCCGTTPEHIAAMAAALVGATRHPARSRPVAAARTLSARRRAPRARTRFEEELGRRFVITAEITPPRGDDPTAMLDGARLLAAAGVDAVHVTENHTARPAMSGLVAAHFIMHETGVPTILHVSCRDRNLLGLQSELLGAAALGVPAIVALTGDPTNIGDFPKATSVFDVTALGLTRILKDLNDGRDRSGSDAGAPTRFRVGAAVNAVPRDLDAELGRLREKVDAGADFAVTQPIFEVSAIAPFMNGAAAVGIPVLVGLIPLRSYANTEYLHNEVPGIRVPDAIRERMRTAADAAAEGVRIARDLVDALRGVSGVAGVYVMAQERYDAAADVIRRHEPAGAL